VVVGYGSVWFYSKNCAVYRFVFLVFMSSTECVCAEVFGSLTVNDLEIEGCEELSLTCLSWC
jgi:hypothetical protein